MTFWPAFLSVSSNLSPMCRKRLIHSLQTAVDISPDKSVYMNNLWRAVIPRRKKMALCDRCNISKRGGCVWMVRMNLSYLYTSADKTKEIQTSFCICSQFLIEVPLLLFCSCQTSESLKKKLIFFSVFTNPSSSRSEIKVALGNDEEAELANIWVLDIIRDERIYHSLIKRKERQRGTVT